MNLFEFFVLYLRDMISLVITIAMCSDVFNAQLCYRLLIVRFSKVFVKHTIKGHIIVLRLSIYLQVKKFKQYKSQDPKVRLYMVIALSWLDFGVLEFLLLEFCCLYLNLCRLFN